MSDLTPTIVPKSNQLNADDLLGGRTLTIRITKVSAVPGDQPIAVNFEGDNGKPYFPCKSMRRVLVNAWGPDGSKFVGRSLTLYRDETVQFGGIAVGGIRISHMSHIDGPVTMSLTATRKTKKPYTVQQLVDPLDADRRRVNTARSMDELATVFKSLSRDAQVALSGDKDRRKAELAGVAASPTGDKLFTDPQAPAH